jgi:hypothetical protein
MEATCSSETSVNFQRSTWCHIPEDGTLHNHRCENPKSYNKNCISVPLPIRPESILGIPDICIIVTEIHSEVRPSIKCSDITCSSSDRLFLAVRYQSACRRTQLASSVKSQSLRCIKSRSLVTDSGRAIGNTAYMNLISVMDEKTAKMYSKY